MFLRTKKLFKLNYFRLKYSRKKVLLATGCNIGIHSFFEGLNKIGVKSTFTGFMGYGSYMGPNCSISGKIGRYCSIAGNVKVVNGTHPIQKFVSTHPVFYSLLKQNGTTFVDEQLFNESLFGDRFNQFATVIGNDVWIGYGATILGGTTIGDGAVILANATVTKDVPPFTIVGGVPAKQLRKRFDEDTINFLLDLKWWNKPEIWLRNNVILFRDIEQMINHFKNSENESCNGCPG